MPKLIAVLTAVLVGAVVALGLCQAMSGREGNATKTATPSCEKCSNTCFAHGRTKVESIACMADCRRTTAADVQCSLDLRS
jgi:hypothetical protein